LQRPVQKLIAMLMVGIIGKVGRRTEIGAYQRYGYLRTHRTLSI
jgi:hypothetical protein